MASEVKFQPSHVFEIYDMVKLGRTFRDISHKLGISEVEFARWRKKNPAVKMAVKEGKKRQRTDTETREAFDDYILGKLSPELQEIWKEALALKAAKRDPSRNIAQLNQKDRQIIFLHAWFRFNFSLTKAKQFTGVCSRTYNDWNTQESFRQMKQELMRAKKDFFEDALIKAVQRNETSAILFANKTLNRDRGYGETKTVDVKGKVEHHHQMSLLVDIESLNLPLEVLAVIAEAMEKRKKLVDEEASKNHNLIELKPAEEEGVFA